MNQVGGNHYSKSSTPWDLIDAYGLNYHEGAAIKYIARNHEKNGDEDVKKAMHELERELICRGYKVEINITNTNEITTEEIRREFTDFGLEVRNCK